MSASPRLTAALGYAAKGTPVFPCEEGGKKPKTKKGFKEATTDEATIREWWGKWPNANIGAPTGAASGLVVLDIDRKNGVDGEASLGDRQIPATLEARTPSGGRHLVFRAPSGIRVKSTAGQLGPGLDVRGDGGYIVVAPSVIDGREYEWTNRVAPAPMPDWMTAKASKAAAKESTPSTSLDRIRDALPFIKADDRETWLKVIWAVARSTERSREGLALVLDWSSKSSKHDAANDPQHIEREYFQSSTEQRDTATNIGSLFRLAHEGGWSDKRRDGDHYRLAQAFIGTIAEETGERPVYSMGDLWVADGPLWRAVGLDAVAVQIGEMFGGGKLCRRASDFNAIARLVSQIVTDDHFFAQASIGIAAASGFWRVTDAGEIQHEELQTAHRQRMRVKADPDSKSKPTRLLRMLAEAFRGYEPDEQTRLVQQLIGAAVTRSLWRYRIAALLLGATSSGKSTLLSIVSNVFPRDQIAATSPHRWANEYYVASLAGKALNIVGELDAKDPIPSGAFKAVTGRDMIEGRHPTHRPFSFVCEAAHFFNTNRTPPTNDHSDAFFRRWRIVQFANSVAPGREIRDLDTQIIDEELGPFLWWALEGAAEVVKAGLVIETETHREALKRWRVENNSALSFLFDREECVRRDDIKVSGRKLYEAYKRWAMSNGLRPFGRTGFYDALDAGGAAAGVHRVTEEHQTAFNGVGLRAKSARELRDEDEEAPF